MGVIECFWLEPTELARSELRRYQAVKDYSEAAWSCRNNPMRYHDTSVYVGEVPLPFDPNEYMGYGRDDIPHDDPRWPRVCETCGTPFAETDHWQHNVQRLMRGAPDGKLYTARNAPPGAMWNAGDDWPKGPDGIALAVCLPPEGGDDVWLPDSPSKGGGAWTRTGTIPRVTCSPSILTKSYHGFLRDGRLESC